MKILIVRSTIPENGPATQSLSIALEMRRLGHTPVYATGGGTYVETVRANDVGIHIIPELAPDRHKPLSILNAVRQLARVIRHEKPDVIHGHNAAATLCAYMAGILGGRRLPCVTSVRGVEERPTHQWRNKIWARTPGLLLGVCEKTRERLLSFGVPDSKIRVTYNGVNLKRFDPEQHDQAVQKEALGLSGRLVVGSIGAIAGRDGLEGPSKGQHNLVKALHNLRDKHPKLSVLLVGDGPKREMVEKIVTDLGLEDRVVFAGRRFDSPEMLSAMDIYCLPSIWGEFFPNSIIEAMAMELPWCGSDIAGLKELTAQGEAGWVTTPDDVDALTHNIDRLAADPALRRSRGLRGRQEAETRFTIARVCQRILNAYAEVGAGVDLP